MTDPDNADMFGSDSVPDTRRQTFAPAEMITCDACLRSNPPTRSNCFYCAENLPAARVAVAVLAAREPVDETTQPAKASHSSILVLAPQAGSSIAETSLAELAAALHLRVEEVQSALRLGRAVPVARTATPEQAAALSEKLIGLGVGVNIFREDSLNLDLPARRIRALEISDDKLAASLMSGGELAVQWDELVQIVTGRLISNRVEVEERRRRGRSQPHDSRELFADEPVCDLYLKSDEAAYRITPNSFDFSCLGPVKAMTAFENFTTLVNLLRARAAAVEVDDSYRSLRAALGNVWPLEPQTRKGEWRRSGAGKVDVSTVTTIDNESQFNRYSRLRRHLKMIELEGLR